MREHNHQEAWKTATTRTLGMFRKITVVAFLQARRNTSEHWQVCTREALQYRVGNFTQWFVR